MARKARPVIPGYPHQVTQWGKDGQPVFDVPADYRRYLSWLGHYSALNSLEIWAYCLMPDHVLYVCLPKTGDALARTFNNVHMRYAQYFNSKHTLAGSLWGGRFLSCALDGPSCFEEIRYIETLPVRAGLAERPEDYAWSSARCHVLAVPDPIVIDCRSPSKTAAARPAAASASNPAAPGPPGPGPSFAADSPPACQSAARDLAIPSGGLATSPAAPVEAPDPRSFLTSNRIPDWRAYLTASLEGRAAEHLIRRTRSRLRTGRPSGDPSFVRTLESVTGRVLSARPRGRPRKKKPSN